MAKKKKRRLSNDRYNQSYSSKDDGGAVRKGILDLKAGGYDKVSWYKPKEGINKIVIVPFEVKSDKHPLVKAGRLEIGDLDYVLDLYVHKYIGPAGADIVCLKENYGKSCPLCELQKTLYKNAKTEDEKEEAKALRAKRRVLYNVLPVEKGELSDEVKVWEVSHFLFEKELIEEANDCSDGEGIIPFADLEEGSVIKFRTSIEKSKQYGESQKYKSFDFYDREEELDESIVDEAVSFDACLVVLSADEMMALYNGGDEDEEEDAPKKSTRKTPTRSRKKPEPEPEEDEDEDEEPEEEEEKPKRKPARKTTSTRTTTRKKKVEESEEEEEDEEEEEEKPKRTTRKTTSRKTTPTRSSKKSEPEEEEEDEEPEEEEEKPKRKPARKPASRSKKKVEEEDDEEEEEETPDGECPSGHVFGRDCDKYKKDCNRCDLWEECFEASEE